MCEATDTAKHTLLHKTAPHNKELSNVKYKCGKKNALPESNLPLSTITPFTYPLNKHGHSSQITPQPSSVQTFSNRSSVQAPLSCFNQTPPKVS